jgi:chromate transport protein ChrA
VAHTAVVREASIMERVIVGANFGFAVLMIAAVWKIFNKAGQGGWKALVPIYGTVVFLRMVERPGWWFLLLCIPVVNLFLFLAHCIDLARVFGKGSGYAAGLAFLTPIFLLMIAFGDAQYQLGRRKQISPELARLYPDRAVDRAA